MRVETWYFSYGSNLSRQQMLRRTGSIPESIAASLPHYRLAFRKVLGGSEVYATIVPNQGAVVCGVVYRCSQHAMDQLDRFEGVAEKCYRRELVNVNVTTAGAIQLLSCAVYIGEAFSQEEAVPGESYLKCIVSGAHEHQLPVEYIKAIRMTAKLGEFK